MATKAEKAEDKAKAIKMLQTFIPEGGLLFHSVNGATDGKGSGRSFRRKFFIIDAGTIDDVSLYVGNVCGIRRDVWGNTVSRYTPQEIGTLLEQRIGRATIKIVGA